jgi:hypothetical protein
VIGACECSNELPGCIQLGEYRDWPRTCQLLRNVKLCCHAASSPKCINCIHEVSGAICHTLGQLIN